MTTLELKNLARSVNEDLENFTKADAFDFLSLLTTQMGLARGEERKALLELGRKVEKELDNGWDKGDFGFLLACANA